MPTIATLNNRATTDAAQTFTCKGARSLTITITNAAVFLSFAHNQAGVIGSLGAEEFTPPQLLFVEDEPIDAVSFRSAAAGTPARITIIATR